MSKWLKGNRAAASVVDSCNLNRAYALCTFVPCHKIISIKVGIKEKAAERTVIRFDSNRRKIIEYYRHAALLAE
jgi:hypothetical protein